jgi:hypothetical protein
LFQTISCERRYSSYSFTTSALDGGEWSVSSPGRALPPVPIVQEAGWAPEPVWTQKLEEKSFCFCRGSNFDRPVVLPVARHCTAWATAHCVCTARAVTLLRENYTALLDPILTFSSNSRIESRPTDHSKEQ